MSAWTLPAGWSPALNHGATCRSCKAPVQWATNDASGKRAPFDADGTSHFATCPDAVKWRRPRRRR